MNNVYKISFVFLSVAVLCFSFGTTAFGQSVGGVSIQTNSATNISNYQATLNGYFSIPYISNSNYVYFQWGTTTSYGSQTLQQYLSNPGSFSQIITGLSYNATYHFRAVAQGTYGTVYGQDMTFYSNQSNNGSTLTATAGPDLYLTSGQTVTLQGSGYDPNGYALNYYWTCNGGTLSSYNIAQPVYTAPYTNNYNNYNNQTTYTCTLMVTNSYGSSNSDSMTVYVNYNNNNNYNNNYGNVYVQTTYATYISNFQATLNGSLSGTNPASTNYAYFQWGTTTNYGNETPQQSVGYSETLMQNIENLNAGTTYHFRAVAQSTYGTVYGQDMTFTTSGAIAPTNIVYVPPVAYNYVYVPQAQVLGASTVSTGLTNNFLTDSFFLPLLLIIVGLWFYFSGATNKLADWLKGKRQRI